MNQSMFIEAHIADIHFGAMDPNEQYAILKEQFIYKLERMPILDIISVNGDIFHHKFMANSQAISVACYFIVDLIRICREKGATLIIITGTYSHDADQIKLFYPLAQQSPDVDIRIIEEGRMEYIRGKKVVCIPEVYGKGEAYYKDLLFDKGFYDACYMHGTYMGAIYGKSIPDLNSNREPVFCIDNFDFCLGPIISGHVHQANCFDSHFYYCGSPYRWTFGDEGNKGFIILLQDIQTHTYAIHYENIICDKYVTLNIDSILQQDPKTIVDFIEQKRKEENIAYIRIELTQAQPDVLNVIQSFYRNNRNVSILDNSKKESVEKEIEEQRERYTDFGYIFNKNITPEVKLSKYINQCRDEVFITPEDLIEILKDL